MKIRAINHFPSMARWKMVAFTCHLPFFLCGTLENGYFYVPFAIFLSAARWKMVAFTCHLPFFLCGTLENGCFYVPFAIFPLWHVC